MELIVDAAQIGGRYLAAAFLCEKILREADGAISCIRIFDKYMIPEPAEGAITRIDFSVFISFRSGMFRGPASVKIRPVTPSGTSLPQMEFPVHFEGDDERGVFVMLNMGFQPQENGLFWFDVLLDEELITRMPLRIVFLRPGGMVAPPSRQ
jgi:hypothetical protein